MNETQNARYNGINRRGVTWQLSVRYVTRYIHTYIRIYEGKTKICTSFSSKQ